MARATFENLPEIKRDKIVTAGIRAFSGKLYQNVSMDSIAKECQISKGILFHYFGSKKGYYLYCLEKAMQRLTAETSAPEEGDFYEVLFDSMNRKIALCTHYPHEMHLVNMASRDTSVEIAQEKGELVRKYMAAVHQESANTVRLAFRSLPHINKANRQRAAHGLHIYIRAIISRFLTQYQNHPDQFFANKEAVKEEIRTYLDLMLYGICEREIT